MVENPEQRFWSKVHFEDDCLIWDGSCDDAGYGQFMYTKAHIWAYEHYVGPVPSGKELDHRCRRRNCVNFVLCLEPVTHLVNLLRGNTLAAKYTAQTSCKRGHPYTEENTRWTHGGVWRVCRQCNREFQQEWRDRRASKRATPTAVPERPPQPGLFDA